MFTRPQKHLQDHKNVYRTIKTFTRPQTRLQGHKDVHKTTKTFSRPFFNFFKLKLKEKQLSYSWDRFTYELAIKKDYEAQLLQKKIRQKTAFT